MIDDEADTTALEEISEDHDNAISAGSSTSATEVSATEQKADGPTFTIKEAEIPDTNLNGAPAAVNASPTESLPYDPRADL